jgi:hypothetical protein
LPMGATEVVLWEAVPLEAYFKLEHEVERVTDAVAA